MPTSGASGLGLARSPTWQAMHRAHATSIPFENLDSHRGIPVSLDQQDLERKMVAERRGGYCFEQNLLLASALEQLGLRVEPMLARVRLGGAPPEARPAGAPGAAGHRRRRQAWHADVGFGLGTLLDPIPFGPDPDTVHEQSGWSFRVVEDGAELVLQTRGPDGWSDVYGFVPRPVPRDRHRSEQLVDLHQPALAVRVRADRLDQPRRRPARGDLGLERTAPSNDDDPGRRRVVRAATVRDPGQAQQFGLPGFELGDDGRVRAA